MTPEELADIKRSLSNLEKEYDENYLDGEEMAYLFRLASDLAQALEPHLADQPPEPEETPPVHTEDTLRLADIDARLDYLESHRCLQESEQQEVIGYVRALIAEVHGHRELIIEQEGLIENLRDVIRGCADEARQTPSQPPLVAFLAEKLDYPIAALLDPDLPHAERIIQAVAILVSMQSTLQHHALDLSGDEEETDDDD